MRGLRYEYLVVDLGVRGDRLEVGELNLFKVFHWRVFVLPWDGDLEGLAASEALLYKEDA
jgi:hypothetical protein